MLGVGLLIELLIPDLSFGSLIILAAGLAFGAAWLFGRVAAATMPALVLTAWGLAGVGTDLGHPDRRRLDGAARRPRLPGRLGPRSCPGGARASGPSSWAPSSGIIGLADVSDALDLDLDIAVLIPLAMIGVGVYLVLRERLAVHAR